MSKKQNILMTINILLENIYLKNKIISEEKKFVLEYKNGESQP